MALTAGVQSWHDLLANIAVGHIKEKEACPSQPNGSSLELAQIRYLPKKTTLSRGGQAHSRKAPVSTGLHIHHL